VASTYEANSAVGLWIATAAPAHPTGLLEVTSMNHSPTSHRGNRPEPSHKDSGDPKEAAIAVDGASGDVGANEQVIDSQPGVSMHELDRLWNWGLHEDELLVNRMSVSLLAQSILLVASVGILTAAHAGTAGRIVEIILDVVGITITASLWHVFTLHADHIKILSDEQRALEPDTALYARIHTKMARRRNRSWVQRHIFGSSRGTKWIMANVISAAILAIWLALLGAAIASVVE
jgi:hypothetical protein